MMAALPVLDPSRAVAYRRTSSREQAAAYGPAIQRAEIGRFADAEGLEIVGDVFEDRSGTLPFDERPGLQQALADALRLGAGSLIVGRPDRLARDEFATFDALRTLRSQGLRVLYADGSNGDGESAQLVEGFRALLAAEDRRRIVSKLRAGRDQAALKAADLGGAPATLPTDERVALGNRLARKQGGPVPFGYRRGRAGLEIDPAAAETVRLIFDLCRQGRSLAKIGAAVKGTGAPTSPDALGSLLRRVDYKRAQPGRIVDPRVWNAAQACLDARRKR